ncbi:hypothetical protein RKD27_005231 [Streptomyces sp. SAI-126]|uniref:hypothetical protein n=2 Tax=Streptomyces TaxID=1883 RepID=UPI001BAFCE44|nr:hypothetical protein [Streptomyces sp. SAI-119]MDH6498538.1 hypothetical protein [Streptomyces sp. SAI-149]QUC62638.1 hypothetical protein IOD14_41020 [Streptomyces sp. A2-16]
MHSRGRVLRFTAVMATVVLALTGFSSGHKSSGRHKSSHRDSDGGGGCSSSSQDHDSYTPSRTTGTRRASALRDGTAVLVSCATKATPYATVEVTNPNSRQAAFEVEFAFDDASGTALSSQTRQITVPAKGTANLQVKAGAAVLAKLDHCRVAPEADVTN